jgi:hypothetical protein
MKKMKDQISDQKVKAAGKFAIAAVIVWFIAALVVGVTGTINEPGRPPVVLASFILVPIIGFITAYLLSPSLRAFTQNINLTIIVGSHLWRFVGLGFVIGWLRGVLPGGFAILAGFGDIIAAAGALILIPMIRKKTASRGWLLAWNIFGLLDLLYAVIAGLLYSNSAFGILNKGISTEPMVTFPVSMIPSFFVPLFILMHLLTFKRIANMKA